MEVTNNTPDPLLAFGWDKRYGYADDVLIPPGETRNVSGPLLGEMGGENCYIHLEGAITCHTADDEEEAGLFQVRQGKPLSLGSEEMGITIRHHLDQPEQYVLDWRQSRDGSESEISRGEQGPGITLPTLTQPDQPSYCLDIGVGYGEDEREDLIKFLRGVAMHFEIASGQRGVWEGTKLLRVETPHGEALRDYLLAMRLMGDDYDYVIYRSEIDASRSMTWLADYDTQFGYKSFSLTET